MASINPISTSIRMTLNLGIVDGKQVEKGVSISKLDNEITPAMAQAVCQSRAQKVLVPVSSCGIVVAGTPSVPLAQSVAVLETMDEIRRQLGVAFPGE